MTVAVPEPPHLVADLGKTHLAIALGMACCQHDYRVRFLTAAELTTLLVEAQQQGRLARKLDHLARFDVVIVDELGYVPFDKAGADLLFGFHQPPPTSAGAWSCSVRPRRDDHPTEGSFSRCHKVPFSPCHFQ